jgi:hypothetical protein
METEIIFFTLEQETTCYISIWLDDLKKTDQNALTVLTVYVHIILKHYSEWININYETYCI